MLNNKLRFKTAYIILIAILFCPVYSADVSAITISLPGAEQFSTEDAAKAYRLVGIPVIPSNPDTFQTLAPFFDNVYDSGLWRLFKLNNALPPDILDYIEISQAGIDQIQYGKGWWIISQKQTELVIDGAATVQQVVIPVNSGWQIVACPYETITVNWGNVVFDFTNNGAISPDLALLKWDGSGDYIQTFSMAPTESYFAFISGTAGNLVIKPSYGAMSNAVSGYETLPRTIPPPPTAPGAYLSLVSPNGDDLLKSGRTTFIQWKAIGISPQGFSGGVNIALSIDGGQTYTNIATSVQKTGIYRWRVPRWAKSDQCLLKVSSVLYPELNDLSDNVFTIQ
ncbi:MAG: hypothetical protein AB7S77_10035 [Desulfatirhabdiaceae bacterium]